MTSLSDRLKSLGIRRGSEIPAPIKSSSSSLNEILNASFVTNNLGMVSFVEKIYPYGYFHGDIQFENQINAAEIHRASNVAGSNPNISKILFLDTETTGLSGGTGTLAFLIGVGRFELTGFHLTQFILEDPANEPAFLLALAAFSEDIQGVVTFNGKSFDMPLLKTRYILNRLSIPFIHWGHLDLLHLSRKIWRRRLPSRSLKDLEQEILHLPRSEDEVPGWMIPEIYFNYLKTGDATSIKNVVYHNAMDIVSLAALFITISQMLDKDLLSGNFDSLDVFSIGQVYESIGDLPKAIKIYEYCLEQKSLSERAIIDLNFRLGSIYKRQLQWSKALLLWKNNATRGEVASCVELAKYFEHEEKDAQAALNWTLQAELLNNHSTIVGYKKNLVKKELYLRRTRLEKRIKPDV